MTDELVRHLVERVIAEGTSGAGGDAPVLDLMSAMQTTAFLERFAGDLTGNEGFLARMSRVALSDALPYYVLARSLIAFGYLLARHEREGYGGDDFERQARERRERRADLGPTGPV